MPEIDRILCVDDEINILKVIRRQLCDMELEVHTALSAEEGLLLLRQLQPVPLVISDYRLPGMNGIEFFRQIATWWPTTSLILLTGFADLETMQDALEQDRLLAVLNKPWKTEELQKLISKALSKSLEHS